MVNSGVNALEKAISGANEGSNLTEPRANMIIGVVSERHETFATA